MCSLTHVQDGEDGCGKTLCMYQVIHWCVRAGWMVVHIPSSKWDGEGEGGGERTGRRERRRLKEGKRTKEVA